MHQIQIGNNKGLPAGRQGISVIEVVIAAAVMSIAFVGILGFTSFSLRQSLTVQNTVVASEFASEELEALRNFRDNTAWNTNGLGSLSLGIAYHAQKSSTNPVQWQFAQGTETISGFLRSIILNQAQRDASNNIVQSGGIVDPNTMRATSLVSWSEKGQSHQVQFVEYLANWVQ